MIREEKYDSPHAATQQPHNKNQRQRNKKHCPLVEGFLLRSRGRYRSLRKHHIFGLNKAIWVHHHDSVTALRICYMDVYRAP